MYDDETTAWLALFVVSLGTRAFASNVPVMVDWVALGVPISHTALPNAFNVVAIAVSIVVAWVGQTYAVGLALLVVRYVVTDLRVPIVDSAGASVVFGCSILYGVGTTVVLRDLAHRDNEYVYAAVFVVLAVVDEFVVRSIVLLYAPSLEEEEIFPFLWLSIPLLSSAAGVAGHLRVVPSLLVSITAAILAYRSPSAWLPLIAVAVGVNDVRGGMVALMWSVVAFRPRVDPPEYRRRFTSSFAFATHLCAIVCAQQS